MPQLFWEEPFGASLAEFLPGVLPDHARRACSMWLAKLISGATWEEAARQPGLPAGRGRSMANRVVSLLSSCGDAEEFRLRILEIASRVAKDPTRVDHAWRRRALSSLTDLPFDEREALCRSAGARPGHRGGAQVGSYTRRELPEIQDGYGVYAPLVPTRIGALYGVLP